MRKESIMGRPLDYEDIASAAKELNVTDAHVRAVIDVETSGAGFLGKFGDDHRLPKILFEAHIFSRETGGQYDKTHHQLSSSHWKRDLYLGGVREHDRLRQAATLDFTAAYRSTSWGLFQIMGFNHAATGYERLQDFVGVQFVSEGMQLQCGIQFILSNGLEKYLQKKDWSGFANGYNGPEYKKNRYHEKLAGAFEQYNSGSRVRDDEVIKLQKILNQFGFDLVVDGIPGLMTDTAIREFQKSRGLVVMVM